MHVERTDGMHVDTYNDGAFFVSKLLPLAHASCLCSIFNLHIFKKRNEESRTSPNSNGELRVIGSSCLAPSRHGPARAFAGPSRPFIRCRSIPGTPSTTWKSIQLAIKQGIQLVLVVTNLSCRHGAILSVDGGTTASSVSGSQQELGELSRHDKRFMVRPLDRGRSCFL
jgi:hypothetical protein